MLSEKSYGAIVVFYNPTEAQIDNVSSLVNKSEKYQVSICVVDNSPNELPADFRGRLNGLGYIHNENKGGIAGAFNRGFDYFESMGDYNVFTLDQDSILPINFFDEMISYANVDDKEVCCPVFFDIKSETKGRFVKLNGFSYSDTQDNTTDFCISSGMLISSRAFKKVGGFDESLVIDHVDTEFALKLKSIGLNIYINRDVCLDHQIGERTVHNLLGVTIKPNHHGYIRKYYIVRNGTYLSFKYFKEFKGYFFLNVLRVAHEFIATLAFENDKLRKCKYMLLGLRDATYRKLGVLTPN